MKLSISRSHLHSATLGTILLLAAGLRFVALAGQSFWADEGNSVVLARRSISAILQAAAADIHPPAYYLLLKAWGSVFGLSEVGARSLSALIGVLVVVGIYRLGRRLADRRLGLLAAFLAALNPFLVYYSQEARMYELLTLCAVVSALAMLTAMQAPTLAVRRKALFLYSAAALLGLYTHYAFPLHLLVLNTIFLLWLVRPTTPPTRRWPLLRDWALAQGISLAFFLPWAPTALRQLGSWPSPPTSLGALAGLQQALQLWLCGPVGCSGPGLGGGLGSSAVLSTALPGLILGLILLGAATAWRRTATQLTILWLLAPLLAMMLFSIFSPAFFKFLLIATPAFLLLLAQGILRLTRFGRSGRVQRLGFVLLLGLVLWPSLPALQRYYTDPTVARDDYRSIAAYIRSVGDANDAIILDAPGQIDAFSQYDSGAAEIFPLPRTRPLHPGATEAELAQILASHKRIYAIFWATAQADPQGLIEQYLAGHAFKAWDSWVGHLRFVAYSAEPAPAATSLSQAVPFGDAIRLQAVGLSPARLQPGDIARVLLQWTATAPPQHPYKVTLQLLDPASQVFAQVDSEPVGGARPFPTWQPAETIADPYGLPIPLATPPGDYPLILAVYDPESGQRLPVLTADGASDHLTLGVFSLLPPDQAPPLNILPITNRADTVVGALHFWGHNRYKQGYGHDPDTPLAPGDALHLSLFWQADAPLDQDYEAEVRLDERPLGRFPLVGPSYPSSQWLPGLPWRGEHSVSLPPELATGGPHRLSLQVLTADGQPWGDAIVLDPPLIY
ncbi:MAG: hypothetical protein GXP37_11375 [Chloroflexi bacterium]|nr:hypothetical protein [Chloroflexota bacterium]